MGSSLPCSSLSRSSLLRNRFMGGSLPCSGLPTRRHLLFLIAAFRLPASTALAVVIASTVSLRSRFCNLFDVDNDVVFPTGRHDDGEISEGLLLTRVCVGDFWSEG